VELPWKGIGGRDAAKGVKGLGRPLYAGSWNGDGAREVWRRSRQTRMSGVLSLWLLSLCTSKEKVTRREGEKRGCAKSLLSLVLDQIYVGEIS